MRLILLATLVLPTLAFAQGALTPPSGAFSGGAPTATMKSLDQIEPRFPLTQPAGSTTGLTISAPGSYYLTGNVTVTSGHGISINADNVTLDLNGFIIRSSASPATDNAVLINGTFSSIAYSAITIRNGHISGTGTVDSVSGAFSGAGFSCGIYYYSTLRSCLISDLTINGVAEVGIYLNAGATIDRCTVTDCGATGIRGGTISNCSATLCGQTAIEGTTILNSQGTSVSTTAIEATTATNCNGTSKTGIGLQATQNATGCTGTTASGDFGLRVGDTGAAGTAENCRGIATGGTGIGLSAETAANCFGQSTGGTGLMAATASNCSAYTASGGIAMKVAGTANSCRGNNGGGGTAIEASIAVSCTSAHGAISATNKYNMP